MHLFDGHVYIFRAYYSMAPMEAPDGTPTHAAYGFASTLIKYVASERMTHGAVCFDHAMESFRNEVEPEYKAQRGEAPDDLEVQFDLCREVALALGFPVFEEEGFEADDVLATASDHLLKRRARVRVVTSDKDLTQLVREDGRVHVYDLARETRFDADAVREKFGVDPSQIPDYLGLVGDAVDNLPGVPGVGAVSAAAVLQNFSSVETIPEDLEAWGGVEVRGAARLAERIALHRDRALLTKELATVRRDVPGVAPTLRELQHRGAVRERVDDLFDRLGWHGIRDRIPAWAPGT
ncbi:MAG: 5'-3' exonuclease H3TH domain-containing protein [Myxococcota bacterium]|nr:5'-3' exonuclease H3TH domain-containing protein [Myxococcota bacterium]